MKKSELLKLFRKNRIAFIKHGKKHDLYYSPITEREFPVPRHTTELKTGTCNNILKEAGLK